MVNPYYVQILRVYKNLYHLGKEYPKGASWFHPKLKSAFIKNKDIEDPKQIKDLLDRANYVVKELEALYSLRKYRAMKERYYDESTPSKASSS